MNSTRRPNLQLSLGHLQIFLLFVLFCANWHSSSPDSILQLLLCMLWRVRRAEPF